MSEYTLQKLKTCRYVYWGIFLFLGFLITLGLASSAYMEHEGHYVTGMDNQIVWGLPHIFAVTLIVIASGVLNIASMSSAFNKKLYKPLAPLSALFAIAFLIAGLIILVLDLGRPDRLIVAMTTYNFKSIFAWNIFLYSGFFVILSIYIWTMLDFNVSKYSSYVGKLAFGWRIILTTGTGSIFGFLVAREAYSTAVLAPLFIVMSLLYGTAVFYLLLRIISKLQNINIPGTGLDSVVINCADSLVATLIVKDLVASEATAYWPEQDIFTSFSEQFFNIQPAELTEFKIKSGWMNINATSTLEDTMTIEYNIPTVSYTHLTLPTNREV